MAEWWHVGFFLALLVSKACIPYGAYLSDNSVSYRGSLLRRRSLLPLQMVYPKGTGIPYEYLLLWIFA